MIHALFASIHTIDTANIEWLSKVSNIFFITFRRKKFLMNEEIYYLSILTCILFNESARNKGDIRTVLFFY